MDSLCWVGSICPNGDLKPACGCQGYRRGKWGTLRTSKTVLDRIVRLIKDLIAKHSLLIQPRGLLESETELRALAAALCQRWLPVRPEVEDCVAKACTVCKTAVDGSLWRGWGS